VQFGLPYGISNQSGQVMAAEVGKILQLAASGGMKVLDTAKGYGDSETVLGSCLTPEQDFSIVTKTLPFKTDRVRLADVAKAEAAFKDSLNHLGKLSVYGLLVHHPADLLTSGGDRLYAALLRWKSEGLVRKIGVSVYNVDEVDRLFEQYAFDLIQAPLNVFDQRFVKSGTLRRLNEAGVEVHARSVFLQGLLLMPTVALPPYFENLKKHHRDYLAELEQAGASPLAGALAYFHKRPEVSTVLVGVETSTQLQECLASCSVTLPFDFTDFAVADPRMLDPRLWG
jgi:aryl-alcohol dehydrogenase-like predicted oxidoreductase